MSQTATFIILVSERQKEKKKWPATQVTPLQAARKNETSAMNYKFY